MRSINWRKNVRLSKYVFEALKLGVCACSTATKRSTNKTQAVYLCEVYLITSLVKAALCSVVMF